MTEDEMVGWHHRLNGHGFGWTPGVGDGQGGLACYSPWAREELNTLLSDSQTGKHPILARKSSTEPLKRKGL